MGPCARDTRKFGTGSGLAPPIHAENFLEDGLNLLTNLSHNCFIPKGISIEPNQRAPGAKLPDDFCRPPLARGAKLLLALIQQFGTSHPSVRVGMLGDSWRACNSSIQRMKVLSARDFLKEVREVEDEGALFPIPGQKPINVSLGVRTRQARPPPCLGLESSSSCTPAPRTSTADWLAVALR